MSDLNLTEAVDAAADAVYLKFDNQVIATAVEVAAPVIERQVRERIAADIEAEAERSWTVGADQAFQLAVIVARVGRGKS